MWEYSRLLEDPTDQYAAFNFFVTAEHIPDWLYPKRKGKEERENLKNSTIALQICSHIANGGKHFQLEAKHHTSVSDYDRVGGYFPDGYFPKGYFPYRYFPRSQLLVHLSGEARKELGLTIPVISLAEDIVFFWRDYFRAEKSELNVSADDLPAI